MRILAIETSCDETASSIVENGTKIVSSVVASSLKIHAKTGGIIPEIAARQQVKSILPVISETLELGLGKSSSVNFKHPGIDAVAVTIGPGLIGSLLVGVETAKTLSYLWQKPIIPVNHLVGHIYANWVESKSNKKNIAPEFPVLALVVSGGHTDLVIMKGHGKLQWIGGTRDDAAGEAFDKTARLLGLPYPGGPAISSAAEKFKIQNPKFKINLPRPMVNEKNFDFSFSGLKTAVLKEVETLKKKKLFNDLTIQMLAHEIQEAIVDCLVFKTMRAVEKYKPKSLCLAGGVAANKRLRESLAANLKEGNLSPRLYMPAVKLCTDNAVYIASAAFYNFKPVHWSKIKAQPELTIAQ